MCHLKVEVALGKRYVVGIAVLLCLSALSATDSSAQAVSGSQVSGIVRDASGGTLPGAEVTITKTDTGQLRTVFTSSDGAYTLLNLAPGPYQLKVSLDGFSTYLQEGIVLQVGSNSQINIELKVGVLSEMITVTASAPLIESRSTGVGQVIDNQRVIELPLNGRQATELILLSGPGHPSAIGRPSDEQELSDDHDFGGRRRGEWHHLHHGWRVP